MARYRFYGHESFILLQAMDTWGSDGARRNKHKNGKMLGRRIFQAMPMIEN